VTIFVCSCFGDVWFLPRLRHLRAFSFFFRLCLLSVSRFLMRSIVVVFVFVLLVEVRPLASEEGISPLLSSSLRWGVRRAITMGPAYVFRTACRGIYIQRMHGPLGFRFSTFPAESSCWQVYSGWFDSCTLQAVSVLLPAPLLPLLQGLLPSSWWRHDACGDRGFSFSASLLLLPPRVAFSIATAYPLFFFC